MRKTIANSKIILTFATDLETTSLTLKDPTK